MYFDQALCHKVSVISFVQYTLAFITSFLDRMFSQSRNLNENNMTLWYYQIRPKVVWKVVHGLMDTINRAKTKLMTKYNMKKKSLLFSTYTRC